MAPLLNILRPVSAKGSDPFSGPGRAFDCTKDKPSRNYESRAIGEIRAICETNSAGQVKTDFFFGASRLDRKESPLWALRDGSPMKLWCLFKQSCMFLTPVPVPLALEKAREILARRISPQSGTGGPNKSKSSKTCPSSHRQLTVRGRCFSQLQEVLDRARPLYPLKSRPLRGRSIRWPPAPISPCTRLFLSAWTGSL